jgi:streptogramin lyase
MPAKNISLRYPWGITLDASGNVYFSDSLSHVVRQVNRISGNMTVKAGNGSSGYGGDGSHANLARLNRPTGITVDRNSNIFIADCDNHRIRKINPEGIISTIAGSGNSSGCDAKSGPSTMIALRSPMGVAVDSAGNLYISDSGHSVIRKVDVLTGIMTVIVGNQLFPSLRVPVGIAVNSIGKIFVGDVGAGNLVSITPDYYNIAVNSNCLVTTTSREKSFCIYPSSPFQCAQNQFNVSLQ